MKEILENVFDDMSETEHEIKCFIEVLNDYKEYCYLSDNTEWENKFIILIKAAEALHADMQLRLAPFNDLIKGL